MKVYLLVSFEPDKRVVSTESYINDQFIIFLRKWKIYPRGGLYETALIKWARNN